MAGTSDADGIDFNRMCRSCLNCTDNMISLFATNGTEKPLSELMALCADLKVSNLDGLPRQMCQPCVSKLQILYEFRVQCRKSNRFLKQCLSMKCMDLPKSDENVSTSKFDDNVKDEPASDDDKMWDEPMNYSEDEIPLAAMNKKMKRKSKKSNEKRKNAIQKQLMVNQEAQKLVKEKLAFECKICCDMFGEKDDLKKHKFLHYVYSCKLCQKRFENLQECKVHICQEPGADDDKEVKPDPSSVLAHCIKLLKCHLCEKEFKYARSLQYHIRAHKGEKPALCNWCGKSFREQRGLINHVRAVHTGEKKFKCSFCPKAFPVSGKRRQHERTHTGEKPYQCDVCFRLFTARTTLNAHRRRHTGEDKFRCSVEDCGQGFYSFSTYQRHMWAHRGERPYPCLHCGKTYLSMQNLRSHIKAAHTKLRDEVCHICGKGFAEKSVLNRHLRKLHYYEPKDNKPAPLYGMPTVSTIAPTTTTMCENSGVTIP